MVRYDDVKLEELVAQSRRLLSIKINDHGYYITRKESILDTTNTVQPRFHRVHTVTVLNDRITCNCSFTPVNGIPCVHVLHVAYLDSDYMGLTKRDVSIFWWKDFIRFGFNIRIEDYNQREINKTLCYLRNHEMDSLCCKQNRYASGLVTEKNDIPELFNRYMHKAVTADNYNLVGQNHQDCLIDNDAPFGLSQDVSLFHNETTLLETRVLAEA